MMSRVKFGFAECCPVCQVFLYFQQRVLGYFSLQIFDLCTFFLCLVLESLAGCSPFVVLASSLESECTMLLVVMVEDCNLHHSLCSVKKCQGHYDQSLGGVMWIPSASGFKVIH